MVRLVSWRTLQLGQEVEASVRAGLARARAVVRVTAAGPVATGRQGDLLDDGSVEVKGPRGKTSVLTVAEATEEANTG